MKKVLLASLLLLGTSAVYAGSSALNGGEVNPPTAVPELDAIGAPVALALVAGIGGIALERRRRKNKDKK